MIKCPQGEPLNNNLDLVLRLNEEDRIKSKVKFFFKFKVEVDS